VVVDSVGCVPTDLIAALDMEVVSLSVAMDGKTYRDGVDLSPQDFYRRLAAGPPYPTTSAAGVADYMAAYERMADRGYDAVVSVALSEHLSTNIDAATTAAGQVGIPVRVLDSRSAAAPQGMVAVAAAKRAAEGATLDEVLARGREAADQVSMLVIIPDLMYLYRGGRLNPIQAGVGRLLQITPVITVRDGVVEVAARERTLRRGLDRMAAIAREVAGGQPLTVGVMEATWRELAEQVAQRVQDAVPLTEPMRWTSFTPVMGAHTGPGTAGFGYTIGAL
jgi:DegV family protein with EDD domain